MIESHTWLPLGWLPRPLLLAVLRFSNRFWIRQTNPDFNLLHRHEPAALFPDAEIHVERFMGMTKSIIAVRRSGPGAAEHSIEQMTGRTLKGRFD